MLEVRSLVMPEKSLTIENLSKFQKYPDHDRQDILVLPKLPEGSKLLPELA